MIFVEFIISTIHTQYCSLWSENCNKISSCCFITSSFSLISINDFWSFSVIKSNAWDSSPISSLVVIFVRTLKSPLATLFAAFFNLIRGRDIDFEIRNATTVIIIVITKPVWKILFWSIITGWIVSDSSISASKTNPKSLAQYDDP